MTYGELRLRDSPLTKVMREYYSNNIKEVNNSLDTAFYKERKAHGLQPSCEAIASADSSEGRVSDGT